MGKRLYLDCTSGISGDMFVAALLDLGADEKELIAGLKSIADDGFDIKISKVEKSGIACTDFDVVFKYIRDNMMENPPSCIIVLTDGYAPFPEESAAMGIPVLWLINNDEITPPWGKIARIEE